MSKKTEFVTVSAVQIRVDIWGGPTPSDIEKNPSTAPEELILMIPGNPGVVQFYEQFLDTIYSKTKKPVWIISHGGHARDASNLPSLKGNEDLYNLNGQIEQKKEFIHKYLQGVKLYCIGHSIGCKMLLEVLKTSNIRIYQCYFLFPTIERMVETPNGQFFTFVYQYFLWLIIFTSCLFINLPHFMQMLLLKLYCTLGRLPHFHTSAILDLIHPNVLNQVFFLANDEMKNVRLLDDVDISILSNSIKLYYGASDDWVPLTYYNDLKLRNSSIDANICTRGFAHSFILKSSYPVAELLSEWIMEEKN